MELTKEYLDRSLAAFPTSEEMRQGFAQLREELANKQDINTLYNKLDDLIKETGTYHQEMQVLRHKDQTMNDWIKQASERFGVEYKCHLIYERVVDDSIDWEFHSKFICEASFVGRCSHRLLQE